MKIVSNIRQLTDNAATNWFHAAVGERSSDLGHHFVEINKTYKQVAYSTDHASSVQRYVYGIMNALKRIFGGDLNINKYQTKHLINKMGHRLKPKRA